MVNILDTRTLMNSTGLSGRVTTKQWSKNGDGAGLNWDVVTEKPTGIRERIAIPTADGRYAIPVDFKYPPLNHQLPKEYENDILVRAHTFMYQGGTDLKWGGKGAGPMTTKEPIHKVRSKPYPITCSHFTGMVAAGYEYTSTTYVADENSVTGAYIPFDDKPENLNIYQACLTAQKYYTMGILWLVTDDFQPKPCDLLFYAMPDPEGSYAKARAGTEPPYFGNVYHVGIYVDGDKIIQSAYPDSPTGVYIASYREMRNTLTFVARPKWVWGPENPIRVLDRNGWERPVHHNSI